MSFMVTGIFIFTVLFLGNSHVYMAESNEVYLGANDEDGLVLVQNFEEIIVGRFVYDRDGGTGGLDVTTAIKDYSQVLYDVVIDVEPETWTSLATGKYGSTIYADSNPLTIGDGNRVSEIHVGYTHDFYLGTGNDSVYARTDTPYWGTLSTDPYIYRPRIIHYEGGNDYLEIDDHIGLIEIGKNFLVENLVNISLHSIIPEGDLTDGTLGYNLQLDFGDDNSLIVDVEISLLLDEDVPKDVGTALQVRFKNGGAINIDWDTQDGASHSISGGTLFNNSSRDGTWGDDVMSGFADYGQTYEALAGNDEIYASGGNDTIYGGSGNDIIEAGAGANVIDAGIGDDVIRLGFGQDTVTGGAGIDTFIVSADLSGDIVITDFNLAEDKLDLTFWADITSSADLTYTENEESLELSFGAYKIDLLGVTWNAFLASGSLRNAQEFDDSYAEEPTGPVSVAVPTNYIDGTSSDDYLGSYTISFDAYNIYGYEGDDVIYGNEGDDYIYGGDGGDHMYGNGGNDVIHTGGGAGGYQYDYLDGGYGDDTLIMNSTDTYVEFAVSGGAGEDYLILPEIYSIYDLSLYADNWGTYLDGYAYFYQDVGEYMAFTDYEFEAEIYNYPEYGEYLEYIVVQGTIYDVAWVLENGWTQPDYGSSENPNLLPVAANDVVIGSDVNIIYGSVFDSNGFGQDYDVNGQDLVAIEQQMEIENAGIFTLQSNGVFSFTPDVSIQSELVEIEYSIENSAGYQNSAMLSINLSGTDDLFISQEDGVVFYGGLGNDTISYENSSVNLRISMRDDYSWSSVNGVTNFYNIENAIGSQYDDIFDISGNDNIVDGGEGIDAVHYYLVSDWDLDINLSTGFVDEGRDGTINDQLISIENAAGGYGDDNIVGNDGANILNGYHGNDTLNGGDGDDELYGDQGDDTVHGGEGSDTLYGGDGNDDLRGQSDDVDYYYGEAGNDYLHGGEGDMLYGGSGDDVMRGYGGTGHFDGGDDIDSVWWRDADAGIVVDLVAGTVTDIGTNEIATIQNVENIIGTDFDDTITGDALGNSLDGGLGADVISGVDGADTIHGRDGADIIYGGDGDDLLYGDNDNDVLYGGDGFDKLRGQAGSDTFVFEAPSAYNDVDLVYDFSLAENDKIDISDLLSGYDANNDVLSDFVQITDENNYSSLSIDADGGADGFVEIARILYINGITDEASLESSGSLITI